MKQLSASYELNETEIVNLVRTYLKGLGHSLVNYSFKIQGGKFQAVELQTTGILPPSEPVQLANHRQMTKKHKKHSKVNLGLFHALKLYFSSEKARGTKTIGFKDLYELIKTQFPDLEEERLQTYLYDRKQLKEIAFSKNQGITLL